MDPQKANWVTVINVVTSMLVTDLGDSFAMLVNSHVTDIKYLSQHYGKGEIRVRVHFGIGLEIHYATRHQDALYASNITFWNIGFFVTNI